MLQDFHTKCVHFPHSGAVAKQAGSPINPSSLWLHLALENEQSLSIVAGFLSVECITSKTEPPGLYTLRKSRLQLEERFGE